MKRRNKNPLEVRLVKSTHTSNFLGRQTCHTCHRLVPRGSDRPFCLDHAEYAQRLMRELEAMEREHHRAA